MHLIISSRKGYFTGHSGKVTCATELFSANVDEQLIQVHIIEVLKPLGVTKDLRMTTSKIHQKVFSHLLPKS